MPIARFKMPDGRVARFEVPDGTSPDQASAMFDEYVALNPEQFTLEDAPQIKVKPEESGILRRVVADPLVGLAQGVVGWPESLVGLANIPTMGYAGKAAEAAGVRFQDAKDILQQYKSPELQQAERELAQIASQQEFSPSGVATIATEAVKRPSTIFNTIMQSAPSMLGGAALARGIVGKAATGAVGAAGPQIPQAATGLSPLVAGAIGEGAVSAGQTAESIRQKTESGLLTPEQSTISAVSGALTSGFGVLGGKVASKYLKVADFDTLMAGGVDDAVKGNLLTSAVKGALAESAFEELPQSVQEQISQNVALGRPWDEGVAESAAMGMLAALPLGGGAGVYGQVRANRLIDQNKLVKGLAGDEAISQQEAYKQLFGSEMEVPDADLGADTTAGGAGAEVPSQPGAGPAAGAVSPNGPTVGGAGVDTGPVGGGAPTVGAALTWDTMKPGDTGTLYRGESEANSPADTVPTSAEPVEIGEALPDDPKARIAMIANWDNYADIDQEQAGVEAGARREGLLQDFAEWEAEQQALSDTRNAEYRAKVARGEIQPTARVERTPFEQSTPEERQARYAEYEAVRKNETYLYRQFDEKADKKAIEAYEWEKDYGVKDKGVVGKPDALPVWKKLTKAEKSLYNSVYKQAGVTEAINALRSVRMEGVNTRDEAFFYEANRRAASAENKIDYPAWNKLSETARQAFINGAPRTSRRFSNVATQLEKENVAFRGIPETEVNRLQTKLQEKSSLQQSQMEQELDKAIEAGTPWNRLLKIIGTTETPVTQITPGAARVINAAGAIANKIEGVLNKAGISPSVQYGRMTPEEIAKNKYAKYDPNTNTITIDKDAIAQSGREGVGRRLDSVLLHEVIHAALDHVLDNKQLATSAQRAAIEELDKLYGLVKNVEVEIPAGPAKGAEAGKAKVTAPLKTQFDIPSLKEFVAEAMSNTGFQRALAGIVVEDPNVAKLPVAKKELFTKLLGQAKDAFSAFAEKVTRILGFSKGQGPVFKSVLDEIMKIISDPGYKPPLGQNVGRGISYAGKKAPDIPDKSFEQLDSQSENRTQVPRSPVTIEAGFIKSGQAWNWLVDKFQNRNYLIKNLQAELEKSRRAIVSGPNQNVLWDWLSTALGKAQWFAKEYLIQPREALQQGLDAYAKMTGKSIKEALGTIGLFADALHEEERRHMLYLRIVPMNINKLVKNPLTGNMEPAATVRQAIFDELNTRKQVQDFTDTELNNYRILLNNMVDPNSSDYAVQAGGVSPDSDLTNNPNAVTDENSNTYNVSYLSRANAKTVLAELDRIKQADPKQFAAIEQVLDSMRELSNATVTLNSKAGFWTPQVENHKRFYNYDKYVPYKGTINYKVPKFNYAQFTDPDQVMLSRDLKNTVGMAGGRTSESQNPILQVLADATASAARAGRGYEYTEAIRNLVQPRDESGKIVKGAKQIIKGKVTHLTFAERAKLSEEHKKLADKKNVIFHYAPDGTMDIVEINDEALLQKIRKPIHEDPSYVLQLINGLTSKIGQFHTRYNPAYPLLGFTRDVLTNGMITIAEGNVKEGVAMASYAAKYAMRLGGTIRRMAMYHAGDINKLYEYAKEREAKGDNFPMLTYEYLSMGGRTAYADSLSVQAAIKGIYESINKHGVMKGIEKIDTLFDIWTDAFEMSARIAAYAALRDKYVNQAIKPGMTPKQKEDATALGMRRAASYVKQFANFEEVGEYGRAMGAAFMFARPSATGAVRAIEAFAPAFQSWESVKRRLPKDLYSDPAALEARRIQHEAAQKAAQRAAAGMVAMGAAMYMAAAMMAGEDDEDRNIVLTDDMARWTRFFRMPIPWKSGEKDSMIQVPWGFGPGAFLAIGSQVAALGFHQTPTKFVGNFANIVLDSFIPIPISRLDITESPDVWVVESILPSVIRPIVQLVMNKNSFGYDIYNARQTRVDSAFIAGDNIPEMYADMAEFIYKASNGDVKINPNILYFASNSYLDGLSRIGHTTYNWGLNMLGEKEIDPKEDMPLIAAFLTKRTNVDRQAYGELAKEVDSLNRRLKTLEQFDEEGYYDYINKHPEALDLVNTFNKVNGGMLKDARKQSNDIRKDKSLTAKERQEMLRDSKLYEADIMRMMVTDADFIKQIYAD